METNAVGISDDDDRQLFECLFFRVANDIVRIKHNDPQVMMFLLDTRGRDLNERACRRLGHILGQNTRLIVLRITRSNLMDVSGLCEGLQNNRCIRHLEFDDIDLQDPGNMSILAPFFSHNSSLSDISVVGCRLTRDDINILSCALANRLHDTIETLDLSGNNFGDIDLDGFVEALSQMTSLLKLQLAGNGIGRIGCTSLARLLENQELNLEWLDLRRNSIDDSCTDIFAGSLATNTKLKRLSLGDNRIVTPWSAFLELVCNRSSINDVTNSNHTLCYFGWERESVERSLGADDANLLRESLEMNKNDDKNLVTRRKILWSHARGDINLGDSDIAMGAMPSILSWIMNDTDEADIRLIQYHEPPLRELKLGPIMLDSVYRILRGRDDLFETDELVPDTVSIL